MLEAARALFLSRGYANTSMEAVAAKALVTKGTLYARFPGKFDLFQAVIDERIAAWRAANATRAADESDLAAWLHQHAHAMLSVMRDPEVSAFDRLVVAEGARFPLLARAFHEAGHKANIDQIAARMACPSGQGVRAMGEAHLAATLFAATIIGWFRLQSSLGPVSDVACDAAAAKIASVFVEGQPAWRDASPAQASA